MRIRKDFISAYPLFIIQFCILDDIFLTLLLAVADRISGSALVCVSSLRSTSWLLMSSTVEWRWSRSLFTGEHVLL